MECDDVESDEENDRTEKIPVCCVETSVEEKELDLNFWDNVSESGDEYTQEDTNSYDQRYSDKCAYDD
jgi:hypothetical protein